MYKTIDNLIDSEFYRVKIDKKFYDKLESYLQNIRYKSAGTDNSEFLGSNLLGVHKFVFSDNDAKNFFKNMLFADEKVFENAYKLLEGLNLEFKVSSNHVYVTCVILMHMAYNSKLDMKTKLAVIKDLFMVLAYKLFGSMYNHFFKYQADPAVAKLAFEELNNKFLLKKVGSWQELFEYRANDVLPGGIFEQRIKDLNVDNMVDVINGVYTRFKAILINLNNVYLEVLKRNEKLTSSSQMQKNPDEDSDGEEFKDNIGGNRKYITYIKSIMSREEDFVDTDLTYVVQTLLPTCKSDKLEQLLSGLTTIPYPADPKHDYVERILASSFSYLVTKGITSNYDKKIFVCLRYLKGYWMAGTIKDRDAREAKQMANELTYEVLLLPNKTVIPAIAIGFILYLFLKAIKGFKN
jgi:hypothetical protein